MPIFYDSYRSFFDALHALKSGPDYESHVQFVSRICTDNDIPKLLSKWGYDPEKCHVQWDKYNGWPIIRWFQE